MALPPEAAEALDDQTSPQRLTEIAETFPELQSLVAVHPSCPEDTRAWILQSNRSAAELYRTSRREQRVAQAPAADDEHGDAWGPRTAHAAEAGEATAPMPVVREAAEPAPRHRAVRRDDATQRLAVDQPTAALPPIRDSVREGSGAPSRAASEPPPLPRVTGYLDAIPTAAPEHTVSPSEASAWAPVAGSVAPAALPPAGAAETLPPPSADPAPTGAMPGLQRSYEGPGEAEQPPRRGLSTFWAVFGCSALAVLLVGIGSIAALALRHTGGDAAGSPAAASASASATRSPSASPSAGASGAAAPAKPAPDGAADLTAVQSPSGNIVCQLGQDTVSCAIRTHSYSGKQDCPSTNSVTLQVGGGDPELGCGSLPIGKGSRLDYGEAAAHGSSACTSESSGMTCWNQRTGHGFTVSKSDYSTF